MEMREPRYNNRAREEVILSHPVITSELIGMEITRGALHLQFSPGPALCNRKRGRSQFVRRIHSKRYGRNCIAVCVSRAAHSMQFACLIDIENLNCRVRFNLAFSICGYLSVSLEEWDK